ncbi:MAG: lamin tail domain-containing protein [Deltaproteobacteria bacterium]|nr:lamin tail domain-containing protein [Deltaproteobacteria bacterium]
MKKKWFGIVLFGFMVACDPGPILDNGEVHNELNNELDEMEGVFSDSSSGADEGDTSADTADETDTQQVDSGEMDTTETSGDTVDTEPMQTDTATEAVDTGVDPEDTEFNESDDNEVDDSESNEADTNDVESNDTEPETVETDNDVDDNAIDTELEVTDTGDEAVDTEMEVADTGEEWVDTEPEVTDTGEEIVDSETETVDSETEVDTVETEVDTNDTESVDTSDDSCEVVLVINEIDYDVPGADTAEFIELYNGSSCDVPLSGLAVVLVNGYDMSEYRRIHLEDAGVETLGVNEYLVIHGSDLVLDAGVLGIAVSTSSFIQNGPDGIALLDTQTGRILDAFCYESAMEAVQINGLEEPVNLVESEFAFGLEDADDDSVTIGRFPDGTDSGNALLDWHNCVATPGFANTYAQ